MAYCLVFWGTFKKVKISFLPIGHTHDDCDQCFSCLNKAFKERDMMTLDDLVAACKVGYPGPPECVHLDNMANWTALFEPVLESCQGIRKPRCFVVRRGSDGVVRHHYRQQMQTRKAENRDCWFPTNSKGLQLLLEPPDLSKLVRVPFKPVVEKELNDIAEMAKHFCSAEQKQWWTDTIDKFVVEDGVQCPVCVDLRETMKDNAKSKHDTKEESRRKGAAQQQARKDMLEHLKEPDRDYHAAFDGPVRPPLNFLWVPNTDGSGGHYVDQVEDDDEELDG